MVTASRARDIGAPLLNRTTPNSPATLTERGTDLLRDLQQPNIQQLVETRGTLIRGWKPDDPRRHRPRNPPPANQ